MKLIAGDWNVEHNGRQLNLAVDNDIHNLEDLDIEPVISCLETIFPTAKALTELTSAGIPESGLWRKLKMLWSNYRRKMALVKAKSISAFWPSGAILALF